jgi:NAD(P)-dependent dehydrogenase (short-subunit alcohol dehydrogenase family)
MINAYFRDKAVVITGASKGIGKEIARQAADAGAKLVLNAKNEDVLSSVADRLAKQGIEVLAVAGDVGDYEVCVRIAKEAISKFGGIDVVIANAGIAAVVDTVARVDASVFRKLMEVNYLGTVNLIKACLPVLRARGNIIIVRSEAGIAGLPGVAAYSASKMALTAFADALRIELRCNKVHVGHAYVAFTENDAEKTVLDYNGSTIPRPPTTMGKPALKTLVARKILEMVVNREPRRIFSTLGLLNYWLHRIWPGLARYILRRYYFSRGAGRADKPM